MLAMSRFVNDWRNGRLKIMVQSKTGRNRFRSVSLNYELNFSYDLRLIRNAPSKAAPAMQNAIVVGSGTAALV
jgi:hypothetical protein